MSNETLRNSTYFAPILSGPMIAKTLSLQLLSVVFAWVPVAAQAQDAALDSMLQLYRTGQHTPKLLNDLCWAHVFNQPDTAIFYGRKALALSRKLKNAGNEATAFNRMGVAFDVKHMPDSALLFYHQAVALSREEGGEKATLAGAMNNIGLIHWNLGELDKAVEFYVQSAELFEEVGNRTGLAHTYNNIGLVLSEDGNQQEALRYNFRALRIREELGDRLGMAASYTNLGLIHQEIRNLDSMVHYTLLSIPIKEELKDDFGLSKSLHNLGYCFQEAKDWDNAEAFFRKALEVSDRVGNLRGSASTLMHLGSVLRQKKDLKASMDYLTQAESRCKTEQDAKLLYKIYEQQGLTNYEMGHYQKAADLFWSSNTLKDSVVTMEKSDALEELETKYRTAVKDRKIEE